MPLNMKLIQEKLLSLGGKSRHCKDKAALQKCSIESNANVLDDSSPQRFFFTLRAHIPLVHNLLVHMRFLPSVGSTVVNWARYDDR
jgi:hypothetical protein